MQILSYSQLSRFSEVRFVTQTENKIINIIEAYEYAQNNNLDLVLVSDQTTPPVVKVEDFKKIQYKKKKARLKSKQKQSVSELKEIQVKMNISEHDLTIKTNAISRFLEKGHKVKLTVRLKGREKENPQRANELIQRVTQEFSCKVSDLKGATPMVILEPLSRSK